MRWGRACVWRLREEDKGGRMGIEKEGLEDERPKRRVARCLSKGQFEKKCKIIYLLKKIYQKQCMAAPLELNNKDHHHFVLWPRQ